MGELSEFEVGQTVELSDGRTAVVHFIGNTDFAAGDWIGVGLDDATGKNDGSVQGQRYFACEPAHGMFVRPAAVEIIEQPTPKPREKTLPRTNGVATKGHPPSMAPGGLRRQSVLDPGASKRQSINAGSPTPRTKEAGRTRLASPSKSPTKQLGSRTSSGNASGTSISSAGAKPSSLTGKPSRLSMAPPSMPPVKPSRPSIVGTMNGTAQLSSNGSFAGSRGPARRMSVRPTAHNRLSSVEDASQTSGASGRTSPPLDVEKALLSPSSQVSESKARGPLSSSLSGSSALSPVNSSINVASSRSRSPPKPLTRAPPATTREAEDLKTKIRVLEKKRQEDREKLKALDKVQGERDKFEAIIQKLQAKYQPQQQELADLKKRLLDEETKMRSLEIQQAENDTVVEVATLDREMAEESAESLKTELDTLRQAHQEMELEVEILREENQELGKEMSPEEKTSQGWLQMERSNERLREALMRLRDVTQQQEADLRAQVEELQRDLQGLATIKDECLHTKESLAQSESIIEDLRQQLETALGAEEMIEELTEKNEALSQKAEKLQADIEELESIKDISDEIELNHTETEKQMLDEIDYHESALGEQKRKSALQDETIQDLEYTVTRFQDLVANMQSDIQDMKASQQITETEANELNDRSKTMMDLNMKLQISASKAQTKAIDIELGKMEAQEAAEHLSIVQRFLPESFGNARNSVLAFLRFRRVGIKATLMHGLVKDRISGHSVGTPDDVLTCCELLEKLTWVSCMCNRFINFTSICSLEAFEKLAGALYDLEPVERALSGWIDGLKRDELNNAQAVEGLQRSIALMTHLAEVHIAEGLEQHADEVQMRATMLQSHLESAATALVHVKSVSQTKASPMNEDAVDDADDANDEAGAWIRKADDLISQIRSAKVVSSKAIRHLEELASRSLTLDQTTVPTIEQAQSSTSEIASCVRSIGHSIFQLLSEEGRTTPFTYSEISAVISPDGAPFASLANKVSNTMAQLQAFYNKTSSLTHTFEIPSPPPPPPWQLLAQKLRDEAAANVAQEAEFTRMKHEVQERNAALAMRDKIVEEMTVKVEVLEKRVGETGGRREQVRELENALQAARAKEKDLSSTLAELRRDLRSVEEERERQRKAPVASTPNPVDHTQATSTAPSASSLAQIQQLKTQISDLESAVRYLRRQTHAQHIDLSTSFLKESLTPPQPPAQSLLQTEARDVLKEMLHLVTSPENQLVKLKIPPRAERLKWRPVKETAVWQTSRLAEEWEEWKEWRDDLSNRVAQKTKPKPYKEAAAAAKASKNVLAKLQIRLPDLGGAGKGGNREVRIVRPGEWEEIEGLVRAEAT